MATHRKSLTPRSKLVVCIFFLICISCCYLRAQKPFAGNVVKITTDQYGFVVGSNQKDTLYLITVTNWKVGKEESEISVTFFDGKGNSKAKLVDQFQLSGKNLALYRYVGNAAKKVDAKYYDDFVPTDNQKFLLLLDGSGGSEEDSRVNPYFHKTHRAVVQEVPSGKRDTYLFNKSGGALHQGMVLGNESTKAIVGIVADHDGAQRDRFAVIKITEIAEQLERMDRNSCRYFNMLRNGDPYTPCERKAMAIEAERRRKLLEETERKNRTQAERREVRRTTDYWFSAGVTASFNSYRMRMYDMVGKSSHGAGYSVGMSFYFNPNPGAIGGSLRPRFTSTSLKMPNEYVVTGSSSLHLRKIDIQSYELPIIIENGGSGGYWGLGYVPVLLTKTEMSYSISEQAQRTEEVFGGPKYVHKIHVELGIQAAALRIGLIYQYQFGPFINQQYEMIVDGQVVKPFVDFDDRYSTFSVEASYRLWSKWRMKPPKV